MRTLVRPAALVESWFDMLPDAQRLTARELRAALLAAEPGFVQAVKWGNLVFMLGGANVVSIVPHKTHANLQFFNGALLAAQWPQLEGTGRGLRHLKCRYGQEIDAALVAALVRDSIAEAER